MQRLKDWTVEDLNEEQKKVHDEIVNKLERMHVMVLAWITLYQS